MSFRIILLLTILTIINLNYNKLGQNLGQEAFTLFVPGHITQILAKDNQ